MEGPLQDACVQHTIGDQSNVHVDPELNKCLMYANKSDLQERIAKLGLTATGTQGELVDVFKFAYFHKRVFIVESDGIIILTFIFPHAHLGSY